MSQGKVRMLVMSDLHCTSRKPGDAAGSFLTTSTPVVSHPIEALLALISSEGLEADLVLCAGDICDKADASGLVYAWDQMHRVAARLDADLVATVGNHDLDHTGKALDVDPKAALVDLVPAFPFDDSDQKHRYWSEDFAIYRKGKVRVVTLNSCALHGHVFGRKPEEWASREPEIEHGRISPATAKRLSRALEQDGGSFDINVLLTHHHVVQLPNVDLADESVMLQAQELLEALSDTGPWLVVHGHKHRARLFYGHGASDAPVILAAGTFAAFPYGQSQSQPQVYLIEFADSTASDNPHLTVAGVVRSWTWSASTCVWAPAASNPDGVLPAISGFGWRITTHQLAKQLAAEAKANGGKIDGDELAARIPELPYVLPADLVKAIGRLGQVDPPSAGTLATDGRIGSVENLQLPVKPATRVSPPEPSPRKAGGSKPPKASAGPSPRKRAPKRSDPTVEAGGPSEPTVRRVSVRDQPQPAPRRSKRDD